MTGAPPRRGYDGPMRRGWVLALLVLGGCYSKATAREGKFTFAYPSMVEHDNFVKPIAPGAKLEVRAFINGTHDEMTLKSAKSSDPNVVAIDSVKDKTLVLAGKTPGVAMIELTAQDPNGNELVDQMFFHVAKPVKHGLQHSCTEEAEAAYVVGEDVFLDHAMATADKRPVIGTGYVPLAIEPRGALDLVLQPQADGFYLFKAKSAKRVTVRSKIDEQALTLKLVDRKDLTDGSLLFADRMLAGRASWIVAQVRAGDTALCNQTALTKAKSLTPEICKVTAKLEDDPDADDSNREQLAQITAIAFGVCKFEVTLPELAKGKGLVMKGEVKVGREEYPRGSDSDPGLAQRRDCPSEARAVPRERRIDERVRGYLNDWSRPLGTIASMKDIAAMALLGVLLVRRRRLDLR